MQRQCGEDYCHRLALEVKSNLKGDLNSILCVKVRELC